ncbi:MAG: hypothetical protein CVU98_01600 [Firmicutes bacterium HGW-Firmicutes-3]|jgi:hypothetical protein|nr:MAG: hypothetical protein CVU98_01600 [Firmicutes bacterium HGW-Firmicutes-3]
MLTKNNEKDERTTFIENQSYKYGYIILTFGILINIIYRSFRLNEAPWDLFGLIFLSGLVTTVYQYKHKIFTKNWIKSIVLLVLFSAIIAVTIALFIQSI